MRDRGRLEPVRRVELAQDVRDVVVGRLDADHELGGDLAVGEPAGDERQHLGLARGSARAAPPRRCSRLGSSRRRLEVEPRALGEQLELAQQRPRAEPRRDGVRLAERRGRVGARARRRRRAPRPAASGSTRRAAGARAASHDAAACRPRIRPRARRGRARARPRRPRARRRRSASRRRPRAAAMRRARRAARGRARGRRRGGRGRAPRARPARAAPGRRAGRGSEPRRAARAARARRARPRRRPPSGAPTARARRPRGRYGIEPRGSSRTVALRGLEVRARCVEVAAADLELGAVDVALVRPVRACRRGARAALAPVGLVPLAAARASASTWLRDEADVRRCRSGARRRALPRPPRADSRGRPSIVSTSVRTMYARCRCLRRSPFSSASSQREPQLREAVVAAAEVGEVDAEHGERAELGARARRPRARARAPRSQIGSDSSWRHASISACPSAASTCARSGEGGSAGTSSTARSNAARPSSRRPLDSR